jgi:ketosteroid isomerase-like protein
VPACRREVIDVLDLGARVVEAGRFTARYARKSDGQKYELIGKYVDLWAKAADGSLSLITQAWNYDQGVPIGDELRFAEVPAITAAFQPRVPVTTNGRLELAALGLLIEKAVIQHDDLLFVRCYADDAIMLPNYGPACRGRAEIDAYAAPHFQHFSVFEKLDIRNDRVDEFDGIIVEYASHVANWRRGDSSGVNTGKNLRIWRRQPDHSLKIIVQIGAYD